MSVYIFRRAGALCVVLTLLFALRAPVWGQEGETWHEPFDDPALPAWEHSPEVSVVDGALQISPNGFALHGGAWDELTFSLRMRCEGDGFGVVGYHIGDGWGYLAVFGAEESALFRQQGGEDQLLAIARGVPFGQWVQMELSLAGSAHTLTVGGQPFFSTQDPDPLAAGGVALSVWGGATCVFDDVELVGEDLSPEAAYAAFLETLPPPAYADVVYTQGDGAPQTLDIYLPEGDGPWPLLIYVHGGGWMAGDKQEGAEIADGFVPQGYAVVSINYRLAPQHPFPAAIADTQCAVAWAREHAAEYGFDAAHVALIGGSAGGHLAALAGVVAAPSAPAKPTWQPSCGDPNVDLQVQAIVSFAGPMDLSLVEKSSAGRGAVVAFLGSACEDAAICAAASPITYVSADAPPMLLVHGTEDAIVPVVGSERMAQALWAAGAQVIYLPVPGAGHDIPFSEEDARTIVDFLARNLRD